MKTEGKSGGEIAKEEAGGPEVWECLNHIRNEVPPETTAYSLSQSATTVMFRLSEDSHHVRAQLIQDFTRLPYFRPHAQYKKYI